MTPIETADFPVSHVSELRGVFLHLKGSIYFMSLFCRIDATVFCMSRSFGS